MEEQIAQILLKLLQDHYPYSSINTYHDGISFSKEDGTDKKYTITYEPSKIIRCDNGTGITITFNSVHIRENTWFDLFQAYKAYMKDEVDFMLKRIIKEFNAES